MQINFLPSAGFHFLRTLLVVSLATGASAQSEVEPASNDSPYSKRFEIHGIPILATERVTIEDLYVTALVYEHMTSRLEPFDMRSLHRESGFRILLIDPSESFLDLPEFEGEEEQLDEADGLGGCIGEFYIALRVGSPHTLIHELGHGIYHSAIQYLETGGATDEEAWYRERVKAVHGMEMDEAREAHGEEEIHEVLLAPPGGFSARLAKAWRNASKLDLWQDDYAGTEPNEYWAEGVAMWFGSGEAGSSSGRALLESRDPQLFDLCQSVFPKAPWSPSRVLVTHAGQNRWSEENERQNDIDDFDFNREFLRFLDRDRSGEVEKYEGAEAMMLLNQEADLNQDGTLSALELNSFFESNRAEELQERRSLFSKFDANGDGRLNGAEIPDDLGLMLPTIDANGDGSLSLHEFLDADELEDTLIMYEQELLEFLHELDQDDDGAFALSDMPAAEQAEFEKRFKALDVNGDSLVNELELMALLEEEKRGTHFEVQGQSAVMTGVIGPITPGRVLQLILEHPEVTEIVMQDMPGSLDDEANVRAARLVRRMGLATHVPAGREVASGATDFFLAGTRRTWEPGAKFGVHSWGGLDVDGDQVPRDDPQHQLYLDFYAEMGIPAEFYWYTLEAASASGIHWMTDPELERYHFHADAQSAAGDTDEPETESSSEHLGGAILRKARGQAPEELRQIGPILHTAEFSPMAKHLTAFGITLAAAQEVPDEFLGLVSEVAKEIFPRADGIDTELQSAVLTHLYRYRALLPVPMTERSLDRLITKSQEQFERLERENSICDIIMANVPEGQVMEVVEHLLHAITDVGLHYQFPDEWGISRNSDLWRAMQQAIEGGQYEIDGYEDLREAGQEVYDRVLLQEFAYWFISTAWNLQERYGPTEDEWQVKDREQLAQLFPEFFATYERTAMKVMRAPSLTSLAKIGPTRAEERDR